MTDFLYTSKQTIPWNEVMVGYSGTIPGMKYCSEKVGNGFRTTMSELTKSVDLMKLRSKPIDNKAVSSSDKNSEKSSSTITKPASNSNFDLIDDNSSIDYFPTLPRSRKTSAVSKILNDKEPVPFIKGYSGYIPGIKQQCGHSFWKTVRYIENSPFVQSNRKRSHSFCGYDKKESLENRQTKIYENEKKQESLETSTSEQAKNLSNLGCHKNYNKKIEKSGRGRSKLKVVTTRKCDEEKADKNRKFMGNKKFPQYVPGYMGVIALRI